MERIAYTVTHDITAKLDSTSSNDILTILANDPDPILTDLQGREGVFHAVKNLYIKNLSCTVEVPSLPETPPPDILNTDTDTTAYIKTMDAEWGFNRKELELLKWDIPNSNWVRKARISLINRGGIPYQQYNIYDFLTANLIYELGQGAKLGIRVRTLPGLLSGDDFVMIDGNYVAEYIILSETATTGISLPIPEENEVTGITDGQILSRDSAWNLNSYELRSSSNLAGQAKVGYWFLRNKLHLLLYGGGSTNGNLKKIQIINQASDSILIEKDLTELIGSDRNTWGWAIIDTSAFYGKMCYICLIDDDNTGQTYSFFSIDLKYIFSEE